jgi:cellulose biosynthesis protein BcsQ
VSLMDYVPAIADGYERPVHLAGILPCAVPAAGRAYKEVLDLAQEVFGSDMLLPPVRRSVAVTEAHAERVPLTARARWAPVTDDYRAVVDELVNRGVIAAEATVASGA